VFCNVGKRIGGLEILRYAKRFGFYSLPPLETPPGERKISGLYHGRNLTLYDPKNASAIDAGRLAFGQFNMLATPLQMAMVGQAIANRGEEMQPYLVDRINAPDGSLVSKTSPQVLGHPIKPQTAAELNQMMQLVVQGGTAATVGFPAALKVAGKTGTAELGLGTTYDAWFVCFAPADHPRYVVAVVVEKQPNGFGASVSAPIAKAILEKLLHG
jgi:peptidoglycan glycosyltransferase